MRGTECVTTHHRRAHRAAASRSRSTSSSSCARRPHLVRGRQDEGSGRACAARAEARWPGGEGLDVATRAIAQRRGAPARVARPLATSSRRRAAGGRRRARRLRVASVASCLEPSVESCQTHMGSSSATLARNIERRAPGERARAAWVWGGGAGRARTAAPPTPHSAPSRMCPISRVPGGGPPAVVHGAGGAARRGAACIRGQGQGRGGGSALTGPGSESARRWSAPRGAGELRRAGRLRAADLRGRNASPASLRRPIRQRRRQSSGAELPRDGDDGAPGGKAHGAPPRANEHICRATRLAQRPSSAAGGQSRWTSSSVAAGIIYKP